MACLVSYEASSSSDEDSKTSSPIEKPEEKETDLMPPPTGLLKSTLVKSIDAAPVVDHKAELLPIIPVHPNSRELICNPTYDELFAPISGPVNPFKSDQQSSLKNMLTGLVQEAHINEFTFENQRRTFDTYGYAIDPTNKDRIVGDIEKFAENEGKTVAEAPKKGRMKRKRLYNLDPASEDFTGPWASYEDEVFDSHPAEDDQVYLDAYLTKRSKKHMRVEQAAMDERTQLHIADPNDYQGRSFLYPPHDIDGVNFRATTAPDRCYLPKRQIYEWNQAHPKGVSVLKLFPQTGHLMLSGGFDSKIKLWEVYNERRLIRSYLGHRQAIRDVDFNNDGTQFLSCSYDRFAKQWDTETGKAINQFNLRKVAFCIKHNPDQDKQHLFLVGCADKKILCYDSRSGEVVQTYDRHLGAVNTVTFVDENRRFISTSDDKSLRIWEWDIPVDFKYIADPSMHSMPAVRVSPNGKYILCQSLDNSISVINIFAGFKRMRKKIFRGHMVSGYACTMDFSPDQRYIISGDGDGMLCLWEWKSCRLLNKWKAHDSVCLNSHWLPHETSKIITSSWDGNIKLWD